MQFIQANLLSFKCRFAWLCFQLPLGDSYLRVTFEYQAFTLLLKHLLLPIINQYIYIYIYMFFRRYTIIDKFLICFNIEIGRNAQLSNIIDRTQLPSIFVLNLLLRFYQDIILLKIVSWN